MAENLSNSNSEAQHIVDNEIALMRTIISQCTEETLISGGQVEKRDEMMFHYKLPSGLHVYSERPFNFENIYSKNINIKEKGNYIYITSQPVEWLEHDKRSHRYNSIARQIIDYQSIPYIEYSESSGTNIQYRMSNYSPMGHSGMLQTRSAININSDLHPKSEYPIRGSILIEGRNGYFMEQDEVKEYVQGSEYFSDIFQKAIEENSKYDSLELLTASNRIRPLFEMLSIEKQRLQERENDNRDNEQGTKKADERMTEIRIAIEGLKRLRLTQDEISYLENILEVLRENNINQPEETTKENQDSRGD